MNIQWTNMTGFGPSAWYHDDRPIELASMVHHHEKTPALVLHPHEKKTVKATAHPHHMLHPHSHRLPYHVPAHITRHIPHPAKYGKSDKGLL